MLAMQLRLPQSTLTMRIYMQALSSGAEPQRYCQLILQQDLLGGWTLIREMGQPGTRATVKREQYLELDAAQSALMKARDQQMKKGFKVMFSQGADEPHSGVQHGYD